MEKTIQINRALKFALCGLTLNISFSLYHVIFGVITHSWWLFAIGVYYAILSIVRFTVLRHKGNNRHLVRFTGIMLMVMSVSLVGTVVLSFVKNRGAVFNLITMLAIATYAFAKITIATVKWIKSRKNSSGKLITLRSISFADAFVSIFSLQRSMLVSFQGMTEFEISIMNLATGSAVCIIVFLLGWNLMHTTKIPYDFK